ncbi:MAG: DUF294 nucleotidyltransferase-like domain-containing protein, partial [Desulfobulbaceae bacterium]|nr:DUF294 nucleotidyltransferase-like domain-containing protein [Desulfobulbaceae bacterium]
FHLIEQGGVRIYYQNEDGEVVLKDVRDSGEYFGAVSLIRESNTASFNVETVEDTFCYLIPRETFLELIHTVPEAARYYLRSMTDKLVASAYAEFRERQGGARSEGALRLIIVPVGDIIKGPPEVISLNDSVKNGAAVMSRLHIGSLLVRNENGELVGIITDKDLRTKVVAPGLTYTTPVAQIMTSPLISVPSHMSCFDALCTMMTDHIHHLAVTREDEVIGLVTAHDVMVLQGTSPLYLFREINAQQRVEGLYSLSRKVPQIIRSLVEEGAKAANIARMITLLNDHILERILSLLVKELGAPPVAFTWLCMGSEGRKEQTFKTDQDNALMYQPGADDQENRKAQQYFTTLAQRAMVHLTNCGFPPCPGDIMASNPKWRQPIAVWRSYFDNWILRPDPLEVRHATIFFDFRCGYGDKTAAIDLRDHLSRAARADELFLYHLAVDCLESRAPLSFFRNFIVEKNGEHKNRLDIKKQGLVPFVDFARVMALKYGIGATNTLDRLRLLADGNHITTNLYAEASEAYEFLMHIRLIHQLDMLGEGKEPDNHLDPGSLIDIEKQTLKEAFSIIHHLQDFLRSEFHLEQ